MDFLETLAGPGCTDGPFVALVSPSVRELLSDSWGRINGLLKRLGARAVHAVDAGVEEFARLSAAEAARKGGAVHVLSACPMAARFLAAKYPAYAGRLLAVPSPMAIQAKVALAAAGIAEEGWALALTPCAFKRKETAAAGFDFRVVELRDFLAALRESGHSLDEEESLQYDALPPSADAHCVIAETVAARAREIGLAARTVKLNGSKEAIAFFENFSMGDPAQSAGSDTAFIEIAFCEGGCAHALEERRESVPTEGVLP